MRPKRQPPSVSPVRAALAFAAFIALLAPGCGASDRAERHRATFHAARAFADLKAEVAIGPRPSGSAADHRDARFIAARLRAAGVSGVGVQRPYLNVVGHLAGSRPGHVILGAHHDTKDVRGFVGANDGASGVALLLELARDLPRHPDGPSIDFAFFDAEESKGPADGVRAFRRSGDRGSRQYVRYASEGGRQRSPRLGSIDAMVLFDMVGDCDLHIPREASSSPRLYRLFGRGDGPLRGRAAAILDDQTPFERAGIPSLDLIDFDYGPGPPPGAWWHTRRDQPSHVCASSLGAVGGAALGAIPRIR
jgi:glutaminyl-peptide cyclotransferase